MNKRLVIINYTVALTLSIMFSISSLSSQEASVPESYSTDILLNMELPPLEVLLEGARSSSQVEFYNLRMEGQELMLKTERRKWQEYFNLHANYQYGIMAISTESIAGYDLPSVLQYSGTDQSWYNMGVSIKLPIDQLFDRRNRIRRQQIKIEETMKERDMWYDEHKMRIIEQYAKAVEMSNNLKDVLEQLAVSEGYYELAKKDYVLGVITGHSLNVAKSQQVAAFLQVEKVKSELYIAILKMEVMSGVKIINKN
ncbi:MAG: TolC family protein [Bacteroidales bacterium]|nr:TolC family protein [Bacteroidales bacterium]MDD4655782.1 TolC family protein [Bacteroidales bacterium]